MPFYHKGIRYEEAGSGFPLLVTPYRQKTHAASRA